MTVLIKILQLLLSLSILVIVHEFGHFLFARIFKTRVEKFYLFFDWPFAIFKRKWGETEYGIGMIPLGGYVKISGMIDESMDKEQMKQPPQPHEFRSKKSWQRLMIMLGGVFFNFIFALLIYVAVLSLWGETYLAARDVKYGILTDSTGYAMGLRNGDKIIAVDGEEVENFYAIIPDILLNERKVINIERHGEMIDIPVTREHIPLLLKNPDVIDARIPFGPFVIASVMEESPAMIAGLAPGDEIMAIDSLSFQWYDEFQGYLASHRGQSVNLTVKREKELVDFTVTTTEAGMLGVFKDVREIFEMSTKHYSFFEAIPAGIAKGWNTTGDYLKQFKLIFSKETKAYESLGGFITIGSIFPGKWNWQSFWNLTAFLSLILAIMNILPIPALDGGHVMFLIYEVVTGRKPSDKFLEYAQITGMIILLALLIFANGNDILKLIRK
ncbi:MAG: RIP metalloprotease RseP [Bacteroidales bacterium]|nr:RIP metalloprotease RseP [Bacteroidales bacterium]MDT8373508.1 RIP metalloprotease RseP [Bacteroidales bacterium]